MRGVLFNDVEVDLHPNTENVRGSWTIKDNKGRLVAWDPQLLYLFYQEMLKVPQLHYLDIGANTGSFCLLAKFHPDAHCVAFEPAWDAFTLLKANIALNGLGDRVQPFHAAVMDYTGTGKLNVPNDLTASGLATLGTPSRFKDYSEQEVPVVRLDDIDLDGPIDLIKIDVEGAEIRVLQGAVGLIDLYKPAMLLEYHDGTKDFGYDRPAIVQMLGGFGYDQFVSCGKEDLWVTHPQGRLS